MKELCAAMAKAFPEIEGATKDTENPAFKRDGKIIRYADLNSVICAIKPALAANGLWFAQKTHDAQGGVCIETVVFHSSGQEMSFGQLFVPASRNDAQGYGSALTYARRYSLMAAFGVAPEDDDGNAATASAPAKQEKKDEPSLTEAQMNTLMGLIEKEGMGVKKFCAAYKISAVRFLPPDKFDAACRRLEELIAEKNPQRSDDLDDEVPY